MVRTASMVAYGLKLRDLCCRTIHLDDVRVGTLMKAPAFVSDCRVFVSRKPGLRLESVRWEEDVELLVLLPEEKGTSIYARSSLLATWALPS